MSYIKKTLQKDERIELQVKLHWINYVYPVLLGILDLLVFIYYITPSSYNKNDIFWLIIFIAGWGCYEFLKRWTLEMAVTNKRVVIRRGIIGINSDEIKNLKIEGIEVEQSVMGRILNYGNVCFGGVGVGRLVFNDVDDPWYIKRKADEIVGD